MFESDYRENDLLITDLLKLTFHILKWLYNQN